MALLLASGAALAQTPAAAAPSSAPSTSPEPQTAVGEVIVTASRRSENLQKSSLAVQAFNSATIRTTGVTQATDLSKLVQGLQVGLSGSTTQIYIRGVGDFSANPLANPGVAFSVDGVYVGRPEDVGVNFYDISRMEVLKGPQGTLYGRNTSGGAINLITNAPTLDGYKADLNLDVGNYDLYHIDGAVNLPLSDALAIRIAANLVSRSGYLSDGTDDDHQVEGRIKLLYQPTDKLSVLVSADTASVSGRGAGYVNVPQRPGSDAWEGTTSPAEVAYAHTFNPNLIAAGPPSPFVHNHFYDVSAQLDWNMDWATLTVIPAYRHSQTDTLSYNDQSQHLLGQSDQETLETRLSHTNNNLKWVAGLYFFDETDPGQIDVGVGPGLLQAIIKYRPHGVSYAAFGEATYSLTDQLRIILGGRYTLEQRSLTGSYNESPMQNGVYVDLEDFGGNKTFASPTWKTGLEYDLTSRNMLYFTASTGFKAGGLTQTVPPKNVYQPEKVLAFELGSRNRFFDNKLQINLEGFYWQYTDQQVSHLAFDTAGNVNFLTFNAGAADIYGVNFDALARLTSADTLHLAVEYDHSRYSSLTYQEPIFAYSPLASGCSNAGTVPGPFVPLATVDCNGFQLPHAPEWSGEVDYTHTFDLASGAVVELSGNTRFSSPTWMAVDFTPAERAPAFAIVNASLTYRPPNKRYSISAYVHNLNNGREYTGAQEQTQAPPLTAANISAPRMYGVQLHVDW